MIGPQNSTGKLQNMIHEDGLQDWLPTLFAILILSILPIAVVAFITLIDRKGEVHEAEKGQLRKSEDWEELPKTQLSEPEQKTSEMGKRILLAFDPTSEYANPGQKASEMETMVEEAIDLEVQGAGTVRKRKLWMVED